MCAPHGFPNPVPEGKMALIKICSNSAHTDHVGYIPDWENHTTRLLDTGNTLILLCRLLNNLLIWSLSMREHWFAWVEWKKHYSIVE